MSAPNPQQAIDAIKAAGNYIDRLLDFQHEAAIKGKTAEVQRLSGCIDDAQTLQNKLLDLRTMTVLADINNAVLMVKGITDTLQRQKTHIDSIVKAVEVAATVLGEIAAIASAVAAL